MSRRLVVLLALTACARGRSDEPVVDGSATGAPVGDARPIDASTTSGTCTQAFTGTLDGRAAYLLLDLQCTPHFLIMFPSRASRG